MIKSTTPDFAVSHVLKIHKIVGLQLQYALRLFLSQAFFPQGEEMELMKNEGFFITFGFFLPLAEVVELGKS
jgi:hypothetical protein